MLTFDNSVHSDGLVSCFIWADEPKMGRVRFCIGPRILEDVLHGENPVHDARNLVLCERNRERIEAACQRAFADRPGERIDLDRPTSTSDFAKPQQRPRPSAQQNPRVGLSRRSVAFVGPSVRSFPHGWGTAKDRFEGLTSLRVRVDLASPPVRVHDGERRLWWYGE